MSEVQSPLSEAEPTSLQELFSRDPFKMSTQDFQQVIAEIRAHYKRLETATANGQKPRQARVHQPQAPFTGGVNFDDLGI